LQAQRPYIVVGLGNPGFEYEETRHNVGFRVADELSLRLGTMWKPGKGEYLFCRTSVEGSELYLLKPLTYMNNSGEAVVDPLERFGIPLRNLIVVVDDFALRCGAIRVREKGTDGGHNGLRSLIYSLNSHEFARIRCGIAKEQMPPKRSMSEFVLSPFDHEEKDVVEKMIVRAADAAVKFVTKGIASAMNTFNRPRESE